MKRSRRCIASFHAAHPLPSASALGHCTWRANGSARVAADSCISMETEGLMDLLRDVERPRDQKFLQPGSFALGRMCDESPFPMRTDTLPEGGHLEGEASTAKVMGVQLRFAFTGFTSTNGTEQSP